MKLSDAKVRKAEIRSKPYKLADGGGLHVLIHSNGSKYWRFGYRFGGKARILAIGKYPEVSIEEAREERAAAAKLIRDNKDPSSAKQSDRHLAA